MNNPSTPAGSTTPGSSGVTTIKSSPWTSDDQRQYCTSCSKLFDNLFNRRHHCRLCGDIFCHSCSQRRALIPPSSIVLQPTGGKKVKGKTRLRNAAAAAAATATTTYDPDRTVTYARTVDDNNHNTLSTPNTPSTPTPTRTNVGTNVNADNIITNNEDGMSFSTMQLHTNEKEDDADDISYDVTQSMLTGYHDDDLSVSVATSAGFSYMSEHPQPSQRSQQETTTSLPAAAATNTTTTTTAPQSQNQNQTIQEEEYYNIQLHSSSHDSESYKTLHTSSHHNHHHHHHNNQNTILYGKGLEERMKLAREPLRVCITCHQQLQSIQEELRNHNSNAMKYNSIDPTNLRRLLNSPLAFTLGHEVRKAAYTLNNLLPMPRRMGVFADPYRGGGYNGYSSGYGSSGYGSSGMSGLGGMGGVDDMGGCDAKDTCKGIVGNFGNVDGVRIPARLLEQAKGVAVLTCIKTGIGFAGVEFGTGLVVTRLSSTDNYWSPPCAIGTAGVSWGALVGVQLSDHVFLLMTDRAVDMFVNNNDGSFQLGADVGVAVGPLGRSLEAGVGSVDGELAPIYTYSLSKGLYAGISLDGKVMVTRHRVNEKFYGRQIDAKSLLNGDVPTPPAAQPLYDALKRCHVYASAASSSSSTLTSGGVAAAARRQQTYMSVPNSNNGIGIGIGNSDNNVPVHELEEEYNMNSRHLGPY